MTTDEERLTVVNVVASTRVAEELDLPDIAIQLNCEYEPEQFPGVVYRVQDPKLAILMFRSGRAVCTGGKDEDNIHTGIDRMIKDLRAAGITTWDLKDVEIEVQNMLQPTHFIILKTMMETTNSRTLLSLVSQES